MNIIKQVFFSSFILLLSTSNLFFIPLQVRANEEQNQYYGDDAGVNDEQIEGEKNIEQAIKEIAGERSLEQEYNEHGVGWHGWAEKIAGAVWGPLIENGAVACGQTRVRWQVTNDCRVHIISVYSPIPDGAQVLVAAIKALDHDPILAFPTDSHKTVVWRSARIGGRPVMHRIRGPIKVYP